MLGKQRVLVTGGAGFIGSHLAERLLTLGAEVRVLDCLVQQVHGGKVPEYLPSSVELIRGDVRDPATVSKAVDGADVIVHFAASVGVGQSMYEVREYCSSNVQGTAVLLEALVNERRRPRRLLVASSMSVYGEGRYVCPKCGPVAPGLREAEQLLRRDWTVRCPECGEATQPCATREDKPLQPTSVYASNKRCQEELVLTVARSLSVPAVALRFFNVYGERQSLSNPYTGVAAIFSSALLCNQRPRVFEDGHQVRDFVHVSDIVNACVLAIETDAVADEVLNIGTGVPTSLLDLVALLRSEIPSTEGEPEILGRFRHGDIRACYADISQARQSLGFEPQVALSVGVKKLAAWVASQAARDGSGAALSELQSHGLVL